MFGRMIRLAALAGAGALAWRWWQNKQAEDRAYSTSDSFSSGATRSTDPMGSSSMSSSPMGSASTMGSSAATGTSSSGFGTGAAGGMRSTTGERVDQVPAQ